MRCAPVGHRRLADDGGFSLIRVRMRSQMPAHSSTWWIAMTFIDKAMFEAEVLRLNASNPNDKKHWSKDRWHYHAVVLAIVQAVGADSILEIGTMGIKLSPESDEMDFSVSQLWAVSNPKYRHDARVTPWPIPSKAYDFCVALRVFHHLTPSQKASFKEAKRVSRNIIIVAPGHYPSTKLGSVGITYDDVLDWNDGVPPTFKVDTSKETTYFWRERDFSNDSNL
jgi:hypothetical protein